MTILLPTISVIIAVASLLFSGWQARLLSRQTALQNASAGTSTLQQIFTWLHNVQTLILREPRLLPYFRGGLQPELTADEEARLRLIAAMYCDVLNIGLHEQANISSTSSFDEWRQFCSGMLDTCPVLRNEVISKPAAYPLLARIAGVNPSQTLPSTP